MTDWQPIESAPADYPDSDDGPKRLLVWVANGGPDRKGAVDFGWVYIGRRTEKRSPRAASYGQFGWDITHWMHEPEGPPA